MTNPGTAQGVFAGIDIDQASSAQDADLVRRIRNRLGNRFYDLGNMEADNVKAMLREAAATIERLSARKQQAAPVAPITELVREASQLAGTLQTMASVMLDNGETGYSWVKRGGEMLELFSRSAPQSPTEPIYQVYSPGSGGWGDTTRYHFDRATKDKRRIVRVVADSHE